MKPFEHSSETRMIILLVVQIPNPFLSGSVHKRGSNGNRRQYVVCRYKGLEKNYETTGPGRETTGQELFLTDSATGQELFLTDSTTGREPFFELLYNWTKSFFNEPATGHDVFSVFSRK